MARAIRIELTYTNRIHGVLSQMLRTNIDAEGRTRTSDTRIPLTLLLVLMLSTFFCLMLYRLSYLCISYYIFPKKLLIAHHFEKII